MHSLKYTRRNIWDVTLVDHTKWQNNALTWIREVAPLNNKSWERSSLGILILKEMLFRYMQYQQILVPFPIYTSHKTKLRSYRSQRFCWYNYVTRCPLQMQCPYLATQVWSPEVNMTEQWPFTHFPCISPHAYISFFGDLLLPFAVNTSTSYGCSMR